MYLHRFRIELEVENGDRTTTFVLFDRDAKKITNTTAEEITDLEVSSCIQKINGLLIIFSHIFFGISI